MESETSILSSTSHISYEDVTLIWLDSNTDEIADYLHTQDYFRSIVNDVKVFDDVEKSIDYIQWIAPVKNIFLIISESLAELALSQSHNISQLEAVYIFCLDKEKHALLINRYAKIRGIFLDKSKLFHQVTEDILKLNEKSFSTHIFAQKHESGIETSMRDYIADDKIPLNWVELFCFILIHLPFDEKQAKQDMLTQCRIYYLGNEIEERRIDEFEQQDSSENIIHWYTRDAFVFRLINKALRTLNIDVIFKFRFFINKLYRQLKSCHTNYIKLLLHTPTSVRKIRTVYRGQLISPDELEKLNNNVGEIISTSSFLSTTENKTIATGFIAGAQISESALFEINIPDSYYDKVSRFLTYTRPFYKVAPLSQFSEENEIIFSMGTTFRIVSAEKESIWRIRLELDEQNNLLTDDFCSFQKKYQYSYKWQTKSTVDERILLLTEKLPESYRDIVNFYIETGIVIDAHQYPATSMESINYYRKGFDLLCKCLPDHFYLIRVIMCLSMGFLYNNLGDIATSVRLGELSLDIVKDYLSADDKCLLVCYNHLAVIYKLDNRPEVAFSIYKDMRHIALKHKNTSALLEIYDKLCGLSSTFCLHEYSHRCQKRMLKYLVFRFTRKIAFLSGYNHSLYLNYKILIRLLQRLIKYNWPYQRKRSLKISLAKRRTSFDLFDKYFGKLKFMLVTELDNPPRLQSSLHLLLASVMAEFNLNKHTKIVSKRLHQDMKRLSFF